MTVTLGFIHANTVTTGFFQSVLVASMSPNLNAVILERGCPNELGDARNRVTKRFLEEYDDEWLWFVDTDIIFEPTTVDRLVSHDKKIVSANYSLVYELGNYRWRPQPCAFKWDGFGDMETYSEYKGLMEVDAVGAGCLLIHRTVLETMDELWWNELGEMGEDTSFCLRAQDAGYDIWFDADLKVLHQKTVWV